MAAKFMKRLKFKKRFRHKKQIRKFGGNVSVKKFQDIIPIYFYIVGGQTIGAYSFANNAVTLVDGLQLTANQDYLDMAESYTYASQIGASMTWEQALQVNNNGVTFVGASIASLPPISFTFEINPNAANNAFLNWKYFQQQFKVSVQQLTPRSNSYYCRFPQIFSPFGAEHCVIGNNCWNSTQVFGSLGYLSIFMGYPSNPVIAVAASGTGAIQIGTLSVTHYIKFMKFS